MKAQLHRPDMAGYYGHHNCDDCLRPKTKVTSKCHGQHTLGDVEQKCHSKASRSKQASGVACAQSAAAFVAKICSATPANPVISRGKTTKKVRQKNESEFFAGHQPCRHQRYAHVKMARDTFGPRQSYA